MFSRSLAPFVAAVLLLPWTSASDPPNDDGLHPRVTLETSLGDVVVELDAERAPITVDNFLHYAESGFYNGTIFHRVIKTFMVQGGGYTPDVDEKKPDRDPIKNEWRNGLRNVRGTIAMARLGGKADSATAQFFINVVDNAGLDAPRDGAAYAVFGKVVEGMEAVDRIRDTEVVVHPKYPSAEPVTPKEPVLIKSVKVSGKVDKDKIAKRMSESLERMARYDADPMTYQKDKLAWDAQAAGAGTVQTTDSGLCYVTLKPGDGPTPPKGASVRVHYTGWLTDGRKFDSSVDRGEPTDFNLTEGPGGVIKGWVEGVSTMKVGEKRRLLIPPELAYGQSGRPPRILPNSILIFDIELLAIN